MRSIVKFDENANVNNKFNIKNVTKSVQVKVKLKYIIKILYIRLKSKNKNSEISEISIILYNKIKKHYIYSIK
ncbi:hypothetical protein KK437_05110 [Clostridioides difficile]|nr:hypothetical protein [Clostridioides difficile]